MSIIQDWLLEKEVREAEKTIAFANKLINPDPFSPFDHRMKANRQLKKKVGQTKAIELITEHGRCLIKKGKNTFRFLDGYVLDMKEPT